MILRTPGYSQSMFTPSRSLSLIKLAMFWAMVSRLAAVTPSRKIMYVLGSVEKAQPPMERIRFAPSICLKRLNSYVMLPLAICTA